MNNQEIFDKVATHLLNQGEKAKDEDNDACVYLSLSGLQCAIGCLIPEDLYTPVIEGISASAAFAVRPEYNDSKALYKIFQAIGVTAMSSTLLTRLQLLHDQDEIEDWREKLIRCAGYFNLSAKAIQ